MEITEWFGPEIKPTKIGWYERDYTFYLDGIEHDWWDGRCWRVGLGRGSFSSTPSPAKMRWRGLSRQHVHA